MRTIGSDILLVAEHLEGRLAPSTAELVAIGRNLATQTVGATKAALLGHAARGLAEALARFGVDVVLVEDPALAEYTGDGYREAVRALVEQTKPRLVLLAHTSQGYDLAPALAGSLDLALVTNCVGVRLDGDRLVATRRLLNEKVQADIELSSERPIVATVRPGSVPPAA